MDVKKEYYPGLDMFRTLCMLGIVLIHVAAIISPFYQWDYHSERYEDVLIHNIAYSVNFILVESFFLIAGFFSAMAIANKGKAHFFKSRRYRILIPLIFTILLINTFEIWFLLHNGISSWADIGFGNFILHAWFLLTLILISLICLLPVDKLFERLSEFNVLIKLGLFLFYMYLPFGIKFVLTILIPMKENPFFYSVYAYFIEKTLYYSIYFFIGYMLYRNENFRLWLNKKTVNTILWAITVVGISYLIWEIGSDRENIPFTVRTVNVLIKHVIIISCCCALFNWFYYGSFSGSQVIKLLTHSAIVIYLFHHPLLLVLGYYLDVPGMTPLIYFSILLFLGYTLSFLIYYIVNSNAVTRFMFGLKYYPYKLS